MDDGQEKAFRFKRFFSKIELCLKTSDKICKLIIYCKTYTIYFIYSNSGGLDWVGDSFAYVAHFVFLRDVWIRTSVMN